LIISLIVVWDLPRSVVGIVPLDQQMEPLTASLTVVVMVAVVVEPLDAIVATVAAQKIIAAKRDEAAAETDRWDSMDKSSSVGFAQQLGFIRVAA
jgi:hypothetical protein